ncbi:hypothetical protein Ddye_022852 [Dipteronia dyeriana]|uniref:Reverse transcriptase n=1 Tax=Dipteronia dyeriana TaxID=168575 RepID=A0AAD9TSQ6_9ROSI|nr:hypothetical protein Ddye_022852 [Dipteronia dyeriana]
MAIKLDISMAYDRVEWPFLDGMMRKLGFSVKLVELVMRCVSFVSYSVCINGDVCGLTNLLNKARENGGILSFKYVKGGQVISHLLSTNDSLIFTKVNDQKCKAIKKILKIYVKFSVQVINYEKSTMCTSPSYPVAEGKQLASLIGIKLVECHKKYLRLPCFIGRSKRKLFSNIVDRMWGKIKGWGEKLLSAGEISNRANLAKQCWRLLKNPDSLAAKVFKGCYFNDGSFLDAKKTGSGSFIWNCLMWGKVCWTKVNDIIRIPISRSLMEDTIFWHYEGNGRIRTPDRLRTSVEVKEYQVDIPASRYQVRGFHILQFLTNPPTATMYTFGSDSIYRIFKGDTTASESLAHRKRTRKDGDDSDDAPDL